MKHLIIAALFALAAAAPAQADEFEDTARRMMDLTQANAQSDALLQQMFQMQRPLLQKQVEDVFIEKTGKAQPDLVADFLTAFEQEFQREFASLMFDITIPIFRQHFTLEDMTYLVKLYEDPRMQVFMQKMPQIMQQAAARGHEQGMLAGRRAAKRAMQRAMSSLKQ